MLNEEPFERNGDGEFYHSQLPMPDEDEEFDLPEWIKDQNYESRFIDLDEDADEDLVEEYHGSDDPDSADPIAALKKWNPTKPEGQGWFVFALWMTEETAYCCWIRPRT